MSSTKILDKISTIKLDTPVDVIIKQLKNLITSGELKPGDRLPAERVLAEKFGVGRGYIREAIMKLEFYGLLKTSPQSGTIVSGLNIKILDSIFTDIINFNKDDFASLIEARYFMEVNAARLAAQRRTEDDIRLMTDALTEFDAKTRQNEVAVDEDMLFHIKLAAASKNTVIESMLLIILPDLIKVKHLLSKDICQEIQYTIDEHHKILNAIIRQDEALAEAAMAEHLRELMEVRHNV